MVNIYVFFIEYYAYETVWFSVSVLALLLLFEILSYF